MANNLSEPFPFDGCSGADLSNWQVEGGLWKPVDDPASLSGGCIYALHFQNDQREIVVQPPNAQDPEFLSLAAESPKAVVPGLSPEDTAALWSKFSTLVKRVPGKREFTMPKVRRGTTVDITPRPNHPPLTDEIKELIFGTPT